MCVCRMGSRVCLEGRGEGDVCVCVCRMGSRECLEGRGEGDVCVCVGWEAGSVWRGEVTL